MKLVSAHIGRGFGWGSSRVSGLLLLGALTIVTAVFGACGGGSTGDSIVRVDGGSVSKAALEHWVPIEAIISREVIPKGPAPRGEVPDPPDYRACVAYTAKQRSARASGPKPSRAHLLSECRQRYVAVREHMLQILITYQWLTAEARAQHVVVSNAELMQHFVQYKREQFKTEQAFQRFLRNTDENVEDQLLLLRMDDLGSKLEQKIVRERGISGAASFFQAFPRRWAARTNCSEGFVVPNCRQYRGRKSPEATV